MTTTKIEWADVVWNPVTGCSPVSAGCDNCYAARMAKRLAGRCGYPKDEPFKVTLHPERIAKLKTFKRGSRVFVNSMSDLFHPDVPCVFLATLWGAMAAMDNLTFMILTKRPERLLEFSAWFTSNCDYPFVRSNIWFGVSVEDQRGADERIPLLLQTPAAKRFVSVEPMLGPVDLASGDLISLDWVIYGEETGPGARPMHPAWPRSLRDQCKGAGAPFFFKGWGEWKDAQFDDDGNDTGGGNYHWIKPSGEYGPYFDEDDNCLEPPLHEDFEGISRVGKKAAGHRLDGKEHRELRSDYASYPIIEGNK